MIIIIESTLKTLSVLNILRANSRPEPGLSLLASNEMITMMTEIPRKVTAI